VIVLNVHLSRDILAPGLWAAVWTHHRRIPMTKFTFCPSRGNQTRVYEGVFDRYGCADKSNRHVSWAV